MESDVAYVRHVDDGSTLTDSSVFDQRYSAHQAISPGYREYGVEPEVNLDHDEEFVPPPSVEPKADFASSALQGMNAKSFFSPTHLLISRLTALGASVAHR